MSPDPSATEVEKKVMSRRTGAVVAIVDSGNDVISSGQPYEGYRQIIRDAATEHGGVAQVAGGVPAMCDGVTQGFKGMEMSLFSRNNIAQGAVIALAPNTHDGAVLLGECDKIFPGLMMGAATFGHLPVISIPSGPMTTGLSNKEKTEARDQFNQGKIKLDVLQDTENGAYHGAGVCTFFGTANTNKAVAEAMGLVLPGSSFINPGTKMRDALTKEATRKMVKGEIPALADIVDERSFVNGIVTLMAMGGSTNHTMHIPAMAKYFGIDITWDDLSEISDAVPQVTNIYPNNPNADINDFQNAGGMAVVMKTLIESGYLYGDVNTVAGQGLDRYTQVPELDSNGLKWTAGPTESGDKSIIRDADNPFAADGGIKLVQGNLGRAVIKTSAVANDDRRISGLAVVFNNEAGLHEAFEAWQKRKKGEALNEREAELAAKLDQDEIVVVIRGQGPRDNGMPELHKAISPLRILQKEGKKKEDKKNEGKKVALLTDGRLSGASGTIPAAIHLSPNAGEQGTLAKVRDGDRVILDSVHGTLEINIDRDEWAQRPAIEIDNSPYQYGVGRELFFAQRQHILSPEEGATMPLPPVPGWFTEESHPDAFKSPAWQLDIAG